MPLTETTITFYSGDKKTVLIPLQNEADGTSFTPSTNYNLIFTAKIKNTASDAEAKFQYLTGAGITHSTSNASVVFHPNDTRALGGKTLYWDIQAQHLTNADDIRTVAYGTIVLKRDTTRQTTTSVPINTIGVAVPYTGPAGPTGATGATGAAGPNTVSTSTTTSISGLLKGTGTNVALAIAGTDYLTPSGAATLYLAKSSNLSDLANTSTARANLGLGTAATYTATSSGTPNTVVLRDEEGSSAFASSGAFAAVQGINYSTGSGLYGDAASGRGVEAVSGSGTALYGYSFAGNLMELEGNAAIVFTVNQDGDVTATSFSGDGSGLTGLLSAQIGDATDAATANTLVIRNAGGSASFESISIGSSGVFCEGPIEGTSAGVKGVDYKCFIGEGPAVLTENINLYVPTEGGKYLATTSASNGTPNYADEANSANYAIEAGTLGVSRTIFGQSFNGSADVNGNLLTNGHLASVPSGGEAGHLITLNGTTPTVVAGRSAWWSDGSGTPSFRNGTGSVVTLVKSSDTALPSSILASSLTSVGTLTNLNVVTHIISTNGNVVASSTGALGISSRSRIYSSSDGTFQFRRNDNLSDASLTAAGITLTVTPLAASSGGTGLTSLGTGIATFLGTPTSANLAAAVTNETGSGSLVFATSPTLVTPLLGTPTSGTLTNCTGYPELALAGVVRAVATTDLVRAAGVSGADSVLTVALVSGKAYRVRGIVKIVGQAGGTLSSNIGGLNCTFENVLAIRPGATFNAGASSLTPYTSLGLHNATGATTQQVIFDGVINTSASGNFVFSWVSTGASATRAAGSYIEATLLN